MNNIDSIKNRPIPLMLGISFIQGILLYALYWLNVENLWPNESATLIYPLWTVTLVVPVMLLMSLEHGNIKRVLLMTSGFALLIALLAMYIGSQTEPHDEIRNKSVIFIFIISMTIACFKALMYLQQRAANLPMSYEVLFTNSWRNFLVMSLASVFVLAFWLILVLWSQLFSIINIDFFKHYLFEEWFLFPALSLAYGLGIVVFRGLLNIIDSISRLLQGLIKLLLPFILSITALFLGSLVFVGVNTLWDTGTGTLLILWLLAIILFFTNAVYQDGRGEAPYSPTIHRLIYFGLCSMPVLSLLSLYGLSLRLMQYGWSVERCWAFLIWFSLTLLSIGYTWGIIKRGKEWPLTLAKVNTNMGLVILALMLLTNSPLLDFRKISLSSQLARVDSGEVNIIDFDYIYAKENLARPGYLLIERLKSEIGDTNPELLMVLNNPYSKRRGDKQEHFQQFWEKLTYRPQHFELPGDLKAKIGQIQRQPHDNYVLFRLDLNNDKQYEYALIKYNGRYSYRQEFYYFENDKWHYGLLKFNKATTNNNNISSKQLLEDNIQIVSPKFNSFKIGDMIFKPE